MHQTGYKGISNIVKSPYFYPGFCKLWFTPIENIDVWPAIDPASQFLVTEPTLKAGATWFGPADLPDKQLGLGEKMQLTAAGPIFRQALECFLPGDDGYTRINATNIAYSELVFVGQVRAGGYFLVFGNQQQGLSLTENEFQNAGTAAGRSFQFSKDSIDPALPLLSFSQASSNTPPVWVIPGGGSSTPGTSVEPLIIPYTYEPSINIPWTEELRNTYGSFPLIQVWINTVSGKPKLYAVVIEADHPPPDHTYFTVYLPETPGFIVVK